jgi:hypothetical protein
MESADEDKSGFELIWIGLVQPDAVADGSADAVGAGGFGDGETVGADVGVADDDGVGEPTGVVAVGGAGVIALVEGELATLAVGEGAATVGSGLSVDGAAPPHATIRNRTSSGPAGGVNARVIVRPTPSICYAMLIVPRADRPRSTQRSSARQPGGRPPCLQL